MPYDISEIKNLSIEERLQIIDEIWETIDADRANEEETFDEEPEVVAMLLERIEKYEKGEGIFYPPAEAKRIVIERLEESKKNRNE